MLKKLKSSITTKKSNLLPIPTVGEILLEKDYPVSLVPVKFSVTFNSEGLPTGIYYARFQNGIIARVWPMLKVR